MAEYRVIIPEERFDIVEFNQNGLPGIGVINRSLRDFEPKIVFAWHLSIIIEFERLAEKGMPSKTERKLVDEFGDSLDLALKGSDLEKPNALFLARITWNATRELIYRVYDPEPPHRFLTQLINEKTYPRQFDYRIDNDSDWKLAHWHLNAGLAE